MKGQLGVTTSLKEMPEYREKAARLAELLGARLILRGNRSLAAVFAAEQVDGLLVAGKRIEYFQSPGDPPFFFHLSMGYVRAKRVMLGDADPLLSACKVEAGDRILDATLGLGADALLLSIAAGETGQVEACEANPIIGRLTEYGLTRLEIESEEIKQAGKRIQIRIADHLEFLKGSPDRSFDIVYFDPMFRETFASSPGLDQLKRLSDHRELSALAVGAGCRGSQAYCKKADCLEGAEAFAGVFAAWIS